MGRTEKTRTGQAPWYVGGMKWLFASFAAAAVLLLAPSSLNTPRCEPETYPAHWFENGLYDFHHDFKTIIAAAKEVDRRVRLCGDPALQPVGPSWVLSLR